MATSTDPCAARGDATSSSDAMLNHWRAVRGIDCLLVIWPGWHVSWSLVCLITQPNGERARSQKAVDPGTSGSPKKPVFPRNLIVLLCTPDVNLTMTYLMSLVFFEIY